jgi:hypothetical protein
MDQARDRSPRQLDVHLVSQEAELPGNLSRSDQDIFDAQARWNVRRLLDQPLIARTRIERLLSEQRVAVVNEKRFDAHRLSPP